MILLAVDAGQSATRAVVVADGAARAVGKGPGVRHPSEPGGPAQVVTAIREAASAAGLDGTADIGCIGLSGYGSGTVQASEIAGGLPAARVLMTSDVVTSHLGALGGRPGAVVAAGTGSVALAADGRGATASADGWGHLLGDDGSGFAIGRAGLAAALRDFDGRGGSPALRRRAEAAFGPLAGLQAHVQGAPDPVRRVASFARAVADAAAEGDDVARRAWTTAAYGLASAVAAAARRVFGPGATCDVACTGGLFAAGALLADPFRSRLAELEPALRLVESAGTSLDGARMLAAPAAAQLFGDRILDASSRVAA